MKKLLLLLGATLLLGCGGEKEETETKAVEETVAKTGEKITIYNLKVEIDPQLKDLAKKFEAETGNEVQIKSVGGGADYGAALKAEFNAGGNPDVFVILGNSDVETWGEVLYDMKDSNWSKDTDVAYVDESLGTIGFPIALESYGLIANNAIFKEAGLDANDIKSYEGLKNAIEVLESKKGELGLDGVVSYTTKETWVTGLHTMGILFDGTGEEGTTAWLNGDGEALNYDGYGELVGLLMEHSAGNLSTVDYNTQVANFAIGKTALLHQGNWALGNIKELEMPTDELVLVPLMYNEMTNDKLPISVPSYYAVNKNGNPELAVEFLDYIATSDAGTEFMVSADVIPAFNSISLPENVDPLTKKIVDYNSQGKRLEWYWKDMPDGFGMGQLGPIFDQYGKNGDKDTFINALKGKAGANKK